MKIPAIFYKLGMPAVRLYWRTFRPKTFGVKILLFHPETEDCLLVLHSYGDKSLWNIPGGGYKPKRESAEIAIRREVSEEFSATITDLYKLTEYQTNSEGKQDLVTIFVGKLAPDAELRENGEVRSWQWIPPAAMFESKLSVARIARTAARTFLDRNTTTD